MRKFLIDFLKLLESGVPPPPNCHHGISFAQYGSDEAGWEDRLAVQLNVSGVFHCFFLDDSDFEIRPDQVVVTIVELLSHPAGNAQIGIGLGEQQPAERPELLERELATATERAAKAEADLEKAVNALHSVSNAAKSHARRLDRPEFIAKLS